MPKVTMEVIAQGRVSAVLRLHGHRMPLLLLHPEAIADLKRIAEAATLRAKAISEKGFADAITEYLGSLNTITAQFDAEAQKFSEHLERKSRENSKAAVAELEAALEAVRHLGT